VAGTATAKYLCVVDGHYGNEDIGGVAIFADTGRLYVSRASADGVGTVMAGATGSQDLGVINRRYRSKNVGGMAVFADIRCLDMGRILACRLYTVVAAHAVTGNICMVENCRYPTDGTVTVVASVAAGYVRWVLADGSDTVVTGGATAKHLGVIDTDRRYPDCRAVTILANIGR
jgi:hypothetical protein